MIEFAVADKPTLDAVAADVAELQAAVAAIPTSLVKSIQRGVVAMDNSSKTVTINTINAAKSSLHIGSTGVPLSSASGLSVGANGVYLSNSKITFYPFSSNNGSVVPLYWELVEFY